MCMNNQDIKRCREFISFCNHVEPGSINARIADSVLSRVHDLNDLTLDSVARGADVSVPSASRFFRKAGFSSFSEFRILFPAYMELLRNLRHSLTASERMPDQVGILQEAYELYRRNLEATFRELDMDALKEVADMMMSASRVYIIGEPSDLQVSFQLQMDLLFRGVASIQCDIAESETILKMPIDKDAVCVFVTVYSDWYVDELVSLAASARSKGSTTVLFHQDTVYEDEPFTKKIQYGSGSSIMGGFASVCLIIRILCNMIAGSPLKNS